MGKGMLPEDTHNLRVSFESSELSGGEYRGDVYRYYGVTLILCKLRLNIPAPTVAK
jgi:hypothetical protein